MVSPPLWRDIIEDLVATGMQSYSAAVDSIYVKLARNFLSAIFLAAIIAFWV